MTGRLNMTGNSVARGDSAVGKRLFANLRGTPKIVPLPKPHIPTFAVKGGWRDARLDAREYAASDRGRYKARMSKADLTMTDHEAHKLAGQYDTRGPLPKGLDRPTKMKAYEARYIASGGRKNEKWKRRADASEVVRNAGVAGATLSAAAILASRGKRIHPLLKKTPGLRRVPTRHTETAGLASATLGGSAELYGEHARARRASYTNSPAGVAGSALSRMQNYTPGASK